MPIVRANGYPNVLLATGPGAAADPRGFLVRSLEGATGPVQRGTHDFWFAFRRAPGVAPNFDGEDMAAVPRPRRGIVDVTWIPVDTDAGALEHALGMLLHETGHHWLVSSHMRYPWGVGWPGHFSLTRPLYSEEFTAAVNDGLDPHGPCLSGRGNCHWSPYINGDGSCMDAPPVAAGRGGWRLRPVGDSDGAAVVRPAAWSARRQPPLPI